MTAALNELGHQLFGWLGPLSIELAALALLALAVGRLIRSPALRHLLWLAVLLKPVAAVVITSPYTVFAPLASIGEPRWEALPSLPVEHLKVAAAAPSTLAKSSAPLTAAGWGALLWLAGAALLSGRILIGCCVLRRMRRQAQAQSEGPLFDAMREARAALDCRFGVEVATSPSIRSPMVLGILRPLVVVPADLVDRVRADELRLVLMHELAHVRRCDNLALLLQRLVTAALFFHPALWLCGRMLRRESEQACDDLVVCATGRPEAYARGLTLVAEGAAHSNLPARRIPMMSTFASTESDLSQRIRRTLKGQASRMGTRARVLAVVLLSPLAVASLPSYGTADNGAGGEPAMAADSRSAAARKGLAKFGVYPDEDMTLGEFSERMLKGMERMSKHPLAEGKALRTRITVGAEKVGVTIEDKPARGMDRMEPGVLLLVVDQDGNMKLSDKPVTLATLGEGLKQQQSLNDSTSMVMIQGDRQVNHPNILEIMEIVVRAGLVNQVIAPEPQPGR